MAIKPEPRIRVRRASLRPEKSRTSILYRDLTQERFRNQPNIIEIQRELNAKRVNLSNTDEYSEKLYKMGETKKIALEALQEEKRKEAEKIDYPFHPQINPVSKKIMEDQDQDALQRTYNWHNQKVEKISQLAEESRDKEENEVKQATQQINFKNDNVFAVSKVKQFVDSYKNESITHSFKKQYQEGKSETRRLTPSKELDYEFYWNKSIGRFPAKPEQKNAVPSYSNTVQDVPNRAEIIAKKLENEVG